MRTWGDCRISALNLLILFTISIGFTAQAWASHMETDIPEDVDGFVMDLAFHSTNRNLVFQTQKTGVSKKASLIDSTFLKGPGDDEDPDDVYQSDPINKPIRYDGSLPLPLPGSSYNSGTAYIVGLEVLYQTLQYYGVTALIQSKNGRIEFEVVESRSGHFKYLNKLDVAFALMQFSRYLQALLCDDPSMENFYIAFTQVPVEEIGFRFKSEMAWALLGNLLPRDLTSNFIVGRRWSSLGKLAASLINTQGSEEGRTAAAMTRSVDDLVKFMMEFNKLLCFVDIRPKPKEALRHRISVNKVLELARIEDERYGLMKELIDQAKAAGEKEQLDYIRDNS